MNLILDIGNTRVKWALFEDDTLTLQGIVSPDSLPRLCRQHSWSCAAVCASGQADLSPLTLSGRPVHILGNKSAGTAIAGKTGKAGTQDKCQKHDCATLLLSHILFM